MNKAEEKLVDSYSRAGFPGIVPLRRYRILRWSILQHYEICRTPLLDVTQSLRIAASFASLSAQNDAVVFAFGVPNISGAVTASAEAGLQIIRLASVCPPCAVRPHIQEGYLLGEYPEMGTFDQRTRYAPFEIDFGRRLVAKFTFSPDTFWLADKFPKVEKGDLYPKDDPLCRLAMEVKDELGR